MDSIDQLPHMPQICLQASGKADAQVLAADASRDDRVSDRDAYISRLLGYIRGEQALPYALNFLCPHPVIIPRRFLTELEDFHVALSRALTNIVQRWYADEEAAFSSRMPLRRHEEELLQCSEKNIFPAYEGHQGNWRPDLLLPANDPEGFSVCEINARFAANGIDLTAWIYKSLERSAIKPPWLDIAADPEYMLDSYLGLFNTSLPMHCVRAKDSPGLVQTWMDFVEERTGMKPRIVAPEDLRLVPDFTSPTGYTLHCRIGSEVPSSTDGRPEELEHIYQVRPQLFLDDFALLAPEIQRQMAFCSAQDIRTTLLIHDKRILGVLLQELDDLVMHHVLSKEQAGLLRKRVIPTFIPGSKELHRLIDKYHEGKVSKDKFILKPIRSGRGEGILFGDELTVSEWEAILADSQKPRLISDRPLYVIQPLIEQAETERFLDEEMMVQRCHLVGTYHSVHGNFVALGAWRIGVLEERTTNMANGRAWKSGSMVLGD
ncbi:hypothetical protein BJX99DRAFT_269795 [Aspergillus californicus]